MFLLQIIGCVVLVFCFASGLDPIDTCSDEYREDFSCFFQQNYTTETQQKGIKFCTLNKFTCLVNQPMTYCHHCPKKQTNPENNWQCYSKDLKPMSYSILPNQGAPNQTDFVFSEGDTFEFHVLYDISNPHPFSNLQFEIDSKNETYLINNKSHHIYNDVYSFPIKNFGTYSLKIFQPAYQKYDKVLFNITRKTTANNTPAYIVVVAVLLTVTFILQGVITIYYCYKRKKFCFNASNNDKDTPNDVITQVISNELEDDILDPVMSPTVNNWGCLEKTLDVFISYRRSNGSQLASLLRTHLEIRKFSVFLDVDRYLHT